MSQQQPVSLGIAGLGGYAATVRKPILEQMAGGTPGEALVRLVAVCEPNQRLHAATIEDLRARGVAVFSSLAEMLTADIEAVWLPVPIELHRPFTEASLAAGKVVMCEKPAAGAIDDLDAMIAARDKASLPVAIGFQQVYHPQTIEFKRRILAGELGKVVSASVMACWPRDDKYYARNNWAGALRRGDAWVLDSPVNNALAHQLNVVLFLLGSTPYESAQPQSIEAELYRARPIENYDTASLRVRVLDDVPVLTLFTHACQKTIGPIVEIVGQRGTLRFANGAIELTTNQTTRTTARDDSRHHTLQRFAKLVRKQEDERAVATLEVARAHLLAVNGASEACAVSTVPDSAIRQVASATPDGGRLYAIPGIEEAFARCAAEGKMLHESHAFPWTKPAGLRDLRGYTHFRGPASA